MRSPWGHCRLLEDVPGLSITEASDNSKGAAGDGYASMEEYLNRTDPRQADGG